MKKPIETAPLAEQEICVICGFCCDGTIFTKASVKPGEKGNLPAKMEESYFVSDDKEYFKLPCGYFEKKCTIYNQKKAHICSAYRCQLLHDYADKKISKDEAMEIVMKASEMRNEIYEEYKNYIKGNEPLPFQKIFSELWEKQDSTNTDLKKDAALEILKARCNIFNALLIRHFSSEKDFKSMMAKEADE
jgi:hypothetical protein